MQQTAIEWFERVRDQSNSMFTTETLSFEEGAAQVKWWREKETIIVKTGELRAEYRGTGLGEQFCKRMLEWDGVSVVELECVNDKALYDKLCARGWKERGYGSTNLYLD